MNAELKIDPEFEAKCPSLTDEEYEQLKENILSEGLILMPLIVWDGIIIDGHNRYRIAQAHPDIAFRTHEKHFANRYEAVSWICKNQLGRRNLTPQQKKYLIGQRYEAEKEVESFHGNQHTDSEKSGGDKSCHHQIEARTRKRLADETGISEGSIQNASKYAKGIDAAEKALPGIKDELLSGAIKPREPDVAAIAKAPPEERIRKAEALRVKPDKDRNKPGGCLSPADKPANTSRQELKEVREVCAEMIDNSLAPAGEDSILETLHGTVMDMIRVCDTLFMDFPRLLTDSAYKAKVVEIMQEPKNYIIKIEEGD